MLKDQRELGSSCVRRTHLDVVHTVPQCLEGSVHHFSFPSPLLHDTGVLVASDQLNHTRRLFCAPRASSISLIAVIVSLPHHRANLVSSTHNFFENVHHVAVLWPIPIHHQHHLEARKGDTADTSQTLSQVVWVLLEGGDAKSHGAAQVLGPGQTPHLTVLQEGEEALQKQVEGEKSPIETKGEVVLLRVDELVTFKKHSGYKH